MHCLLFVEVCVLFSIWGACYLLLFVYGLVLFVVCGLLIVACGLFFVVCGSLSFIVVVV